MPWSHVDSRFNARGEVLARFRSRANSEGVICTPARLGLRIVLVALLLLPATGASSAPEDAAAAAAGWLAAQQNADGSWGSTPETRALLTSEAVIGLRAYGKRNAAYFRGITWLENRAMTSADAQARRIVALLPHGDDVTRDSGRLSAGISDESFFGTGWGLAGAYGASALDSGLSLQAFGALGVPGPVSPDVQDGVNFLLATQSQGSDSGWQGALVTDNAQGDPVTTALVLRGFASVRGPITGHEAGGDAAASFLLTAVTAASSSLQQAHSALAVLRWTPGTQGADGWLATLEASQAPDGSWNSDPYTTSVALQALAAKLGTDDPLLQANVFIADLGLRAAINLALGSNRVDAITRGEMLTLTDLDASDFGIEDLTGIEEAQSLVSIDLRGNDIADLSPLDLLPNLTTILIATPCDPNDDGVIDVADALFTLQALNLGTVLTASELAAVDVAPPSGPDGELTVGDAVVIVRAAGGESVLACAN